MKYWVFLPTIAVLSLFLTAALRKYALARSLVDVPNARSSHSIPTPRGGGVAVVVAFLLALPFLNWFDLVPTPTLLGVGGAGVLVAVVGFMDDHGHIAARWRLLGHFSAALWALYWLGGLPEVQVFGFGVDLGWIGHLIAAFYLVWMLNLYNFMDGIDGVASIEAMCSCFGACLLYFVCGYVDLLWLPMLLFMAVAGFLYWNFPPARIFMGDAGSGFLGITLGCISLQAAWVDAQLLWGWLILLGVFIVDATFTLIRRLARGDKVYEAHRSHAYQFASRHYRKHLPVTLAVAAINLLWLLPVALAVVIFKLDGFTATMVAYVPLIVLAIRFRAGQLEESAS